MEIRYILSGEKYRVKTPRKVFGTGKSGEIFEQVKEKSGENFSHALAQNIGHLPQ